MAKKIILRTGETNPIVLLEIVCICVIAAIVVHVEYEPDWFLLLVMIVFGSLVLGMLFMYVRIFRYIFAILCSLGWGYLAYAVIGRLSSSGVSPWLAGVGIGVLSLYGHYSYFRFNKEAEVIDVRRE